MGFFKVIGRRCNRSTHGHVTLRTQPLTTVHPTASRLKASWADISVWSQGSISSDAHEGWQRFNLGMEAKEVRIKWSLELNQQKSSHLKRNSKPARHFPDRWNLKWFACEELLSMSLLNLIRILVNLIPSQQISIVGSYVEVWTLRSRRSRKWEI